MTASTTSIRSAIRAPKLGAVSGSESGPGRQAIRGASSSANRTPIAITAVSSRTALPAARRTGSKSSLTTAIGTVGASVSARSPRVSAARHDCCRRGAGCTLRPATVHLRAARFGSGQRADPLGRIRFFMTRGPSRPPPVIAQVARCSLFSASPLCLIWLRLGPSLTYNCRWLVTEPGEVTTARGQPDRDRIQLPASILDPITDGSPATPGVPGERCVVLPGGGGDLPQRRSGVGAAG